MGPLDVALLKGALRAIPDGHTHKNTAPTGKWTLATPLPTDAATEEPQSKTAATGPTARDT